MSFRKAFKTRNLQTWHLLHTLLYLQNCIWAPAIWVSLLLWIIFLKTRPKTSSQNSKNSYNWTAFYKILFRFNGQYRGKCAVYLRFNATLNSFYGLFREERFLLNRRYFPFSCFKDINPSFPCPEWHLLFICVWKF